MRCVRPAPPRRSPPRTSATAPTILAGRLYALQLAPQQSVYRRGARPEEPSDGAYRGLPFCNSNRGDYRVSVDAPAWIDVAAMENSPRSRTTKTARLRCTHKIVEFNLASASRFVLQLSGARRRPIRLTVTLAPRGLEHETLRFIQSGLRQR